MVFLSIFSDIVLVIECFTLRLSKKKSTKSNLTKAKPDSPLHAWDKALYLAHHPPGHALRGGGQVGRGAMAKHRAKIGTEKSDKFPEMWSNWENSTKIEIVLG